MGKGKAKGFRPPRGDDPNMGMLYGSAAHLTGDTIASPVQLRQEGRALPKGHMNYGDEWGKGTGKGGKGEDSATGANTIAVPPKDGSLLPASSKAKAPAPSSSAESKDQVGTSGAGGSSPSSPPAASSQPPKAKAAAAPAKAAVGSTPSRPSTQSGVSEIERRRAALSEIERRRAAMLERERAASQTSREGDGDGDDPEARRLALEARRRQAEERARQASAASFACKEEADEEHFNADNAEVKDEDGEEQGEFEDDEEDEVSRAIARRKRLEEEEEGGDPDDDAEDSAAKRQRTDGDGEGQGAMKQGLQHWAERVNALAADTGDEDLISKCRDFVRKRILQAHAEGNLHSVDWGEEPVPTVDELAAMPAPGA